MASDRVGEEESLARLVAGLDPDEMAGLLVRAALDHDDVARAVRLSASSDADRLRVLRAAVDQGLRTRRFLDYWASSRWAGDAAPIVDALRVEASRRPSRDLVTLIERGVGHLVKVLGHADDSDGAIGTLAQDVLDVHGAVCDAGVADPVALAKWMVRFTFEDQDFFVVDPVRYATALGDPGLATYRTEVGKREATNMDGTRPFAARYAAERLAIIDRDVASLVDLLGGDLSAPHQFVRVAEAMLELDDPDAALAWTRRGITETRGWQVAKLYDLAATILSGRGGNDAVFELRLHQHERMPSSTSYGLLKVAAEAVERWDAERSAARQVLEQRSPSGYIDALLDDHDTDAAWAAAMANPDWQLEDRQWQRLATARETDDPAAALDVYVRLADSALTQANKNAYRIAVGHIKAAQRAATRADLDRAFTENMGMLRERYRRRPTLIAMFDKAKLP